MNAIFDGARQNFAACFLWGKILCITENFIVMKAIFDNVMKNLVAEQAVNNKEGNPLTRISKNIRLVVNEMGVLMVELTFWTPYCSEEDAQAECNKNYIPRLYGKLIFYRKLFDLEIQRLHSTPEKYAEYCATELEQMRQFFVDHKTFCMEFYSGNTDNDKILFIKSTEDECPLSDTRDPVPDEINSNTVLLARLYAYEEYREALRQRNGQPVTVQRAEMDVTYKGTIIALVELILYIWKSEEIYVNGEPAGQEYVKTAVEQLYGVLIDNFPQRAYSLKSRKKELFSNFETIKRKVVAHIDQLKPDRSRRK